MKISGSVSEFSAAVAGQVVGSMLSPESYVGWQVKGASWLARGLKLALQQAGIAGVADLATQANLIQAGVQEKFDLLRSGVATAGGAATGAITSTVSKSVKGQRDSLGITPEGPPQQHPSPEMKVEEQASFASKWDTPGGVPPDVSGSPVKAGEGVPGAPTLEAQALVSHDAPVASQLPGEKEVGQSPASGQHNAEMRAIDALGVASDASPRSPGLKDGEQVPGISASETKDVAPTTPPVGSKKDQVSVSSGSQVSNPKRWERIDLNAHESTDGEYHTIAKHVAKGYVFLQVRLDKETWLKRVSTFIDDRQAHSAVHMVLDNKADEIAKWLANPKSPPDFGFSFVPPVGSREYGPTGLILERKTSRFISGSGGKVYLRKDQSMSNGFRIITSYPIP